MDAGERVICISASGTRTYYAINETDGITYTTDGIVYLINHDIKHPKWILSYEEIAKRGGGILNSADLLHNRCWVSAYQLLLLFFELCKV